MEGILQPILFSINGLNLNINPVGCRGVPPPMRGFIPMPAVFLRIFGVTKDSTGAALAGATVSLFETLTNRFIELQVSDGSGNYEFRSASLSTPYYVVAYKAGSPDTAGTTTNTLVGA